MDFMTQTRLRRPSNLDNSKATIEKQYAKVNILVGNRIFRHVSRKTLADKSTFFHLLLYADRWKRNNDDTIQLRGISSNTFADLLNYLTKENLKFLVRLNRKREDGKDIKVHRIIAFIELLDMYGVLLKECEKYELYRQLVLTADSENACKIYECVKHYLSDMDLEHLQMVICSQPLQCNFSDLTVESLVELTSLDFFKTNSEDDIVDIIDEYIKTYEEEMDTNSMQKLLLTIRPNLLRCKDKYENLLKTYSVVIPSNDERVYRGSIITNEKVYLNFQKLNHSTEHTNCFIADMKKLYIINSLEIYLPLKSFYVIRGSADKTNWFTLIDWENKGDWENKKEI